MLYEINWEKLVKLAYPFRRGFDEGVEMMSTLWVNPHNQPIITPLHFDLGNGLHCVFKGKKVFTFAEPALTPHLYAYPQYHAMGRQSIPYSLDGSLDPDGHEWLRHTPKTRSRFMNVTIHAGQCIYQPGFWWHEVYSYPGSISVNLNAFEEEEGPVLQQWRQVSHARHYLLWKVESWVVYSFVEAIEEERQALGLVNGFFTSAAESLPVEVSN